MEKETKKKTLKEPEKKVLKNKTKVNKASNKKQAKQKSHFIKDVISELKKVRWPLKKEMLKYSIATLVVIALLAIFFIASDLIIAGIKGIFI